MPVNESPQHFPDPPELAGQKPAAVGLFAVYGDPMTGQFHGLCAGTRGHRQADKIAGSDITLLLRPAGPMNGPPADERHEVARSAVPGKLARTIRS